MKEFEVTFYFAGSEVGHLIEGETIDEVTKYVANKLRTNDIWILDEGLAIITKNVQHFLVSERT
jgi:hypothetical protein